MLKPKYKLQDAMMSYVKESLDDSDLIIYIVEANKNQLADESIQKKF